MDLNRGGRLSPDWAMGSNFRRYLLFPTPLSVPDSLRLRAALAGVDLGPYLPWHTKGGSVLVPRDPELEKFYLLPLETVCFARTARDPEHDAALVRVLGRINREARVIERERGLAPFAFAKSLCDDCGAHEEHRSRRMIHNRWPVADGRTCAPWQGVWFDQIYGETHETDQTG